MLSHISVTRKSSEWLFFPIMNPRHSDPQLSLQCQEPSEENWEFEASLCHTGDLASKEKKSRSFVRMHLVDTYI